MYSKLLLLLAAFFAATIWFGCDDGTDCGPGPDPTPEGPYGLQIVSGAPNDTVYFLPGDQATTTVTVIVTDDRGLAFSGIDIDVTLLDPSLGYIEYLDNELRDTTNALGRVNMVFHSIGIVGNELISASCEGSTAQRVLVIREFDPATFTAHLELDPDTIYMSELEHQTTSLSVRIVGNGGVPVPNLTLSMVGDGLIGVPPPFFNAGPTDHEGHYTTEIGPFYDGWFPFDITLRYYAVGIAYSDTAEVTLLFDN